MLAPVRSLRTWVLVAAVVAGSSALSHAQRIGREGAPPPEMRGVIKALDAAAGTITVTVAAGRESAAAEKTFAVAKDAEVALAVGEFSGRRGAFREGKLADLAAGATVSLTLSADQKTVESIAAEGPLVRGVLKSVDATARTLAVTLFPTQRDQAAEDKTYPLAADAEIALDDGRGRRFSVKEGKLADLIAGGMVTLRLSVDQKHAQGVTAEGPMLNGSVKGADAVKGTITVATFSRGADGPEEKTLAVAPDALVLLDDGRGRRLSLKPAKLAEVPVGAAVSVRLSIDQKLATQIQASGPSVPGLIKGFNLADGTITVAIGGRGDVVEKTIPLAKDGRILVDNAPTKLEDLKIPEAGLFAMLRMSLDQKTIQGIFANPSR